MEAETTELSFETHSLESLEESFTVPMDPLTVNILQGHWTDEQFRLEIGLVKTLGTNTTGNLITAATFENRGEAIKNLHSVLGQAVDGISLITQPIVSPIIMVFWNSCVGARSTLKKSIRGMLERYNIPVFAVFEPRSKFLKLRQFFCKIGFKGSFVAPPAGDSSGVFLFWSREKVKMDPVESEDHVVHVIVKRIDYNEWLLCVVLYSENDIIREHVFKNLKAVACPKEYSVLFEGEYLSIQPIPVIERHEAVETAFNQRRQQIMAASLSYSNQNSNGRNVRANGEAGIFLINTDGVMLPNGKTRYGGVVRNEKWEWHVGFCGSIGYGDYLKAELFGIQESLMIALSRNWLNRVIQSGSFVATELVHVAGIDTEDHPHAELVQIIRNVMVEVHASLINVRREKNRCARLMAAEGVHHNIPVMIVLVPSDEMVNILAEDMEKVM